MIQRPEPSTVNAVPRHGGLRGLFVALLVIGASRAYAFDDYTGPLGGTTSFYGQLSPSVISVDDGTTSKTAVVDNSHSNSRIGFFLTRPASGREFRFRFETSLGFRQSDAVSQTSTGQPIDWEPSDIRYVDFSWKFENLGRLSIGHGSMATNSAASADLSGTGLVTGVSVPDMAGGFEFRTATGALSGITVNSAYKTFEGIRRARLRYDTRDLRGLTFSVAAGAEVLEENNSEENYDMALIYQGERGEFSTQGSFGGSINKKDAEPTQQEIVGSFSVLHKPTGLNFTVSGGHRDPGGRGVYTKLGYIADWIQIGRTALSMDYLYSKDVFAPDTVSHAWGIGIVQNISAAQMDLYLGYRNYSVSDASAISYENLQAIQFGTRWRF